MLPLITIHVSEVVVWRWISSFVPGCKALNKRCEGASRLSCKLKFCRKRGFSDACVDNEFRSVLFKSILCNDSGRGGNNHTPRR